MSFAGQVAADAARCSVIAVAAVAVGSMLAKVLAQSRSAGVWGIVLAPWLAPALLVSYIYAPLALWLGGFPAGTLALHSVALLFRLSPIAAVVLSALPPPLRAADRQVFRQISSSGKARFLFYLRGSSPAPLIAAGIVFIFAFSDFELAALWSLKTWPVMIFDTQTGGLPLAETFRLIAAPLAIELVVLTLLLARARRLTSGGEWQAPGKLQRGFAFAYLTIAAVVSAIVPAVLLLVQSARGWPAIAAHFALGRELLISLGFALVATGCALRISQFAQGLGKPRTVLIAAPGLLGALVLSLVVALLFRLPILRLLYDTPVPLLFALTLLLLPLALALRWLLAIAQPDEARHFARSLPPSTPVQNLRWQLEGRRTFLAIALPFCVAYLDFTAGSLLAPIALPPVFPRLHNLAHYGQTAVLSAMILAAFATPLALAYPARAWFRRILISRPPRLRD